jgi:hypothetical protein
MPVFASENGSNDAAKFAAVTSVPLFMSENRRLSKAVIGMPLAPARLSFFAGVARGVQ